MKQHILAKINDGTCRDIGCPASGCKQVMTYHQVKHCVDPENYEKYDRFLLTAALNSDPDCRWCPRPGCGTAMLGEANQPMLVCPNEKCTCQSCVSLSHVGHGTTADSHALIRNRPGNFSFCFNCREEVSYHPTRAESGASLSDERCHRCALICVSVVAR